jgi:hypothetical protein
MSFNDVITTVENWGGVKYSYVLVRKTNANKWVFSFRSLKYCDFRLLDEHCSFRSSLELEFNAVSRYINNGLGTSSQPNTRGGNSAVTSDHGRDVSESESDSRNQFCSSYPLPVLLVSRAAYR